MKFRKKPIEVEAWHFELPAEAQRPDWLTAAILDGDVWFQGGISPYLTIRTPEGEMRANEGDWIIRGVKGESYPCKPGVFAMTYEAVP